MGNGKIALKKWLLLFTNAKKLCHNFVTTNSNFYACQGKRTLDFRLKQRI
jgi:hypothetical protein